MPSGLLHRIDRLILIAAGSRGLQAMPAALNHNRTWQRQCELLPVPSGLLFAFERNVHLVPKWHSMRRARDDD